MLEEFKKIRGALKRAKEGKGATRTIDGEEAPYIGYGIGGRFIAPSGGSKTQKEVIEEEEAYSKGLRRQR